MENCTSQEVWIGIDVSADQLDISIRIHHQKSTTTLRNEKSSIEKFFKRFTTASRIMVAVENTGRYNWPLYQALKGTEVRLYVISPLHLKKSLGLVRGKNDKIDAERIVDFLRKNIAELKPWVFPREVLLQLSVLLSQRNGRMKMKTQLQHQCHSIKILQAMGDEHSLMEQNQQLIQVIDGQIREIENQIEQLIASDARLSQLSSLIRSVPGVGKVLCWNMLVKTGEFLSITDARKMACYAGVVPFECRSGTSLYKKPRVSFYADKTLKKILHMAAMRAVRLNNDMQQYYLRKVEEGKNKMAVLNAVRNKIIHRIFAVVNSEKYYVNPLLLS